MSAIEINRDVAKKVRELLNSVITSSLFDPGGDPDACQKWAAAYAFVALELLGLPINDQEEVSLRLTPGAPDGDGEPNPDETDYLGWARGNPLEAGERLGKLVRDLKPDPAS